MDICPIRRALISVSDKTGLEAFAAALAAKDVEILSTGGTAKALRAAGIAVRDVADVTNFPEMMDGRVKTLHPMVHGGLLALRDNPEHQAALKSHGIPEIDLLVVNLYPFEATVTAGAAYDDCIENIDIGGPAMIRAAAKNHGFVSVVVDVEDYDAILAQLDANGGTTLAFRQTLAQTAYARTAAYDAAVSTWMAAAIGTENPRRRAQAGTLAQSLRYGENPHQKAAFYHDGSARPGVATAVQHQGKELSYNNINDTDAAFELVGEFYPADGPACAIIKHANPCGVAIADNILSAYQNGFTGFDAEMALNALWETSTKSHINSNWEMYNKYGYYPFDLLDNESVSRTLESGYDDWCVAEMARKLGRMDIAKDFQKRALYYRNLYDPETTFLRGKNSNGAWRTTFDPLMATSPLNNPGDYTEANAWQYFWTPAQYDVLGMMQLLGGEENFTKKLNAFFTTQSLNPNKFLGQEAMIGQYAHGNEPSHHILYLYGFTKEPKTGQKYIHQVVQEFHNNTPDGMIGNDDCGQMSAWYVLSTLGFYPVNPANGTFVFGSPQVKKASIRLPNEAKFVVKALHFSDKKYYQEHPSLNNQKLERNFIRYSEIMQGGRLTFQMSNK